MDTTAFDRLRADFLKATSAKTGALVASVVAALTYVALLLLLYLFVDLLVWKGAVPSYSQLSAAQKAQFWNEWKARTDEDRDLAGKRLGLAADARKRVTATDDGSSPLTPAEWEQRWRAGVYLALREKVSEAAADAAVSETADGSLQRVGLLSLVARDRNRWTGTLSGKLARLNTWAWRPVEGTTPNLPYLTGLALLALVVALVRVIALNAAAYLAASATLDAAGHLRKAVYLHAYRLGHLAVNPAARTEAVGVFTKHVDDAADAMHAWMTSTVRHPLKILSLVVLILLLNFWLAVSFLFLALLVWVIGGQLAAHYRREARLGARQAEGQLVLLREGMGLLRLVKGYQMERFNQTRMQRQLAEVGRASWRKSRGEAMARPIFVSVALLAGVALAYLAGRAVLAGDFTVAGLVVMGVAVVSLVPPVAGVFAARRRLRRGREAAEAIGEFFQRKDDALEAANAEYLPELDNSLQFRAVTLTEPGTGRKVLNEVTFAVPARTRVAIVGADPAEKRAVAHLLMRFTDPTEGELRIDDKNIKYVTHESLRAHAAVVLQDDLTYSDTLLNNIGCGDAGFNLPQVIEAAKLAHAHQFIERLPNGYETVVGEFGVSLTPGERFRVGLARALLRNPRLLVIEEPAGPIDEDTLALFDDTLARLPATTTVIFLANRLSTLKAVKRVFFLRDGKLVDDGTHDDMWRRSTAYRRLPLVADAGSVGA